MQQKQWSPLPFFAPPETDYVINNNNNINTAAVAAANSMECVNHCLKLGHHLGSDEPRHFKNHSEHHQKTNDLLT